MEKVLELKECVEKISKEAFKFFEKNNKLSGVRARKKLQKCKNLAQEIRLMIQKSKQEQVQKKSAAAAASAAASGADLLNQKGLNSDLGPIINTKTNQYNSFSPASNLGIVLPNENNSNEFFYPESQNGETLSTNGISFQNRNRLDDIPTWNGDRIDLFN